MTTPENSRREPDSDLLSQKTWLGRFGLVLRKHEQVTLFSILIVCVLVLGGYFLQLHWQHGKLIDIDEMDCQATSYQVDLNDADWPELANLPNIGEKLAKAIINYRTQCGGFESIEQLNDVPGIGPAKLDSMREYLLPVTSDQEKHPTSGLDSQREN